MTQESRPPYDRTALSKAFLRGESDVSELDLEATSFYEQESIELLLGATATGIDTDRRQVRFGTDALAYTSLVLATGSDPARLAVPGADGAGVRTLRSFDSGDSLRTAAEAARTAVVAGSGFIACEVAASLAARGLEVTMVTQEPAPQAGAAGR